MEQHSEQISTPRLMETHEGLVAPQSSQTPRSSCGVRESAIFRYEGGLVNEPLDRKPLLIFTQSTCENERLYEFTKLEEILSSI